MIWYDKDIQVSQDLKHDDEYTKICRCRPGYMKLVMMILVIKDFQVSSTPKSLLPVESVLLDNCTAEHYHLKLGLIAIIIIVTRPVTTINNHWRTCNLISRNASTSKNSPDLDSETIVEDITLRNLRSSKVTIYGYLERWWYSGFYRESKWWPEIWHTQNIFAFSHWWNVLLSFKTDFPFSEISPFA